ncbi:hypothetical protein FA15DRAFT_758769 [Coprinopsis marcescibilis]|uniref:Uncharacterized protein n=1 Tax=Coprinopsis marcescibilis TaxID=230819 RepID=A0A5C3KZF8_COPMA|nr:hypothetical protein FA15DRAFT_758769 [Coprinopsis marcescibilis]
MVHKKNLPHLPEELLREIVCNFKGQSHHPPKETVDRLRTLSLVSPGFRRICQEHLFSRLELGPISLKSDGGHERLPGSKLLSLFNGSPMLVTFVKHIIIHDSLTRESWFASHEYTWLLFDNNIAEALKRIQLENITSFAFYREGTS